MKMSKYELLFLCNVRGQTEMDCYNVLRRLPPSVGEEVTLLSIGFSQLHINRDKESCLIRREKHIFSIVGKVETNSKPCLFGLTEPEKGSVAKFERWFHNRKASCM